MDQITPSTIARFEAKFTHGEPDECWEWQAGREKDGYGQFWITYRSWPAHRVSWTIYRGPIPGALQVLHRCDNPPCINPSHLFLGTNLDNILDMSVKERGAKTKLTAADVTVIKARLRAGEKGYAIAPDYGVTAAPIYAIRNGKTWKHVP